MFFSPIIVIGEKNSLPIFHLCKAVIVPCGWNLAGVRCRQTVRKQTEQEDDMGLFSYLFGKEPPIQPPVLVSILPPQAAQRIYAGMLPNLQADKLILNSGETCHFVDVAAIITEKKHYESRHDGASFRVFKGFTYHTGDTKSVPVVEPEYTKGILYFTGRRIVFVARKFGFDQKISKLTAVTPYTNGMELQFGNKTFTLLLPDGTIAKAALDLIL